MYGIKYYNDEIGLIASECRQPGKCICNDGSYLGPRCGYSATEAKQRVEKYYRERIEQLQNQSVEQFITSLGFEYNGD